MLSVPTTAPTTALTTAPPPSPPITNYQFIEMKAVRAGVRGTFGPSHSGFQEHAKVRRPSPSITINLS